MLPSPVEIWRRLGNMAKGFAGLITDKPKDMVRKEASLKVKKDNDHTTER